MTNEPLAAEGIHASATPELPPFQGTSLPVTLSLAEGSSMGLPAGSTAQSEVQPSTGVAKSAYTATSTNHISDLPGIRQQYLLAAHNLASAAAPQPQIPEKHSLLTDSGGKEETPETVEQPTASTPIDERFRMSERSERPMIGWSPFSPTGPQSTHGSSVDMGSPYFLPLEDAVSHDQVRRKGNLPTGVFFACARLSPRHRADHEAVPPGSSCCCEVAWDISRWPGAAKARRAAPGRISLPPPTHPC